MNFLQPSHLWFSLFLLIPVILHMITRLRIPVVPFPDLRFLKAAQRTAGRGMSLKRLLLLLVRILLVLLLAIAIAHPWRMLLVPKGSEQKSVVLLLDSSMSMQTRTAESRQSLFQLAIKNSEVILGELQQTDRVAVVCGTENSNFLPPAECQKILANLQKKQPKYSRFQPEEAVKKCVKKLASEMGSKLIFLLSDFQKSNFANYKPPVIRQVKIINVDVKPSEFSPQNLKIVQKSVRPTSPSLRANCQIISQIIATQKNGRNGTLRFEKLEEAAITQQFECDSGEIALQIPTRFAGEGQRSCSLHLEVQDDLTADDHYYFSVDVSSTLYFLILGSTRESTGWYLQAALNPEDNIQPEKSLFIQVMTEKTQNIPSELLAFDCIIVDSPPTDELLVEQLQTYVRDGGSLLIFPDVITDLGSFNQCWSPLLPAPLLAREGRSGSTLSLFKFAEVDLTHELFRRYTGGDFTLDAFTFFRFYPINQQLLKKDSQVLARFTGNIPAIIERQFGEGKILFFAAGFNRKDSNVPFSLQFVPFVQELARTMKRGGQWIEGEDITAGYPLQLTTTRQNATGFQLLSSDGHSQPITIEQAGEKLKITSLPLETPGHYVVQCKDGARIEKRFFSVNVEAEESQLDYLPQLPSGESVSENQSTEKNTVKGELAIADTLRQQSVMQELAFYFFLSFLFLLLLESYLTLRMDRQL